MEPKTFRRVRRMMREKSDKELRDLTKKLQKSRRTVTDKLHETYKKLWDLKESKELLGYLGKQTKIVRGKRKGMHCPAMGKNDRDRWTCKAKVNVYWWYDKDTIYERKCSGCRWRCSTRKKKMVFNEVFRTGKDNAQ